MWLPSLEMSCKRRELLSTFSDPAKVITNVFNLPAVGCVTGTSLVLRDRPGKVVMK